LVQLVHAEHESCGRASLFGGLRPAQSLHGCRVGTVRRWAVVASLAITLATVASRSDVQGFAVLCEPRGHRVLRGVHAGRDEHRCLRTDALDLEDVGKGALRVLCAERGNLLALGLDGLAGLAQLLAQVLHKLGVLGLLIEQIGRKLSHLLFSPSVSRGPQSHAGAHITGYHYRTNSHHGAGRSVCGWTWVDSNHRTGRFPLGAFPTGRYLYTPLDAYASHWKDILPAFHVV